MYTSRVLKFVLITFLQELVSNAVQSRVICTFAEALQCIKTYFCSVTLCYSIQERCYTRVQISLVHIFVGLNGANPFKIGVFAVQLHCVTISREISLSLRLCLPRK